MMNNNSHKALSLILLLTWLYIGIVNIAQHEFPFYTSVCLWILVVLFEFKELTSSDDEEK